MTKHITGKPEINDIWFTVNVGEITTEGDGNQYECAFARWPVRFTFTQPGSISASRGELHRLLDDALDKINESLEYQP